MKIVDKGIVFAGKPASGYAKTCFPLAVQLSNGDLLASFQVASVKNGIDAKAAMVRSVDGGKTWSEPVTPFDATLNGKPGVLHLAYISELQPGKLIASVVWCDHRGDAKLEFFNPATGGVLPLEACVSVSDDNGKTWSPLNRIDKGPLEGIPAAIMGPVHKLDNGTLICPFETSKVYEDAGPWLHKAAYFISYDNGRTWPEHKVVAHDPKGRILFWDHRIANLGKGQLLDFFWAYDAVENKELNAYMSKTNDFGKTWSEPSPTSIVGQPWPIPVDNGRFAVVAVDRNYSQTIKLYLTNTQGESFDAAEPLTIYHAKNATIHDDTLNEQLTTMGNWAYGLPSGSRLTDGQLLIIYYAGNDASTDVNWCKVKI